MSNTRKFFLFASLLLLLSCSFNENKELPSYTVTRSNFEHILPILGSVEPVKTETANCPRQIYGTLGYIVEEGTFVKEGDLVAIVEEPNLQTQYDNLLSQQATQEARLEQRKANLELEYANLEAQVHANEADAQLATMDSLQLQYLTPNQRRIKELELTQLQLQRSKLERKLSMLKVIQQTDLRKEEVQVQRNKMRREQLEEQLASLEVKAPSDGLVIYGISWMTGLKLKLGDRVFSMQPLVSIPFMTEMKLKFMATEMDYKQINVNDSVYYTFDAMPDNAAWGKVTLKSPVGQPIAENSKVKVFEMESSIDSCLQLPDPGFSATCNIVVTQVKDTIVVPQIAIFDEDSMKVVYIKHKQSYEMRQVQTGLTSNKSAIISDGLLPGEEIALAKPKASWVNKQTLLPQEEEEETAEEESTELTDTDNDEHNTNEETENHENTEE